MAEATTGVLRSVRLLQPWMGWACASAMVALVVLVWWWRTRHLPVARQIVPLLVGGLVAVGCWLGIDVLWHPVADGVGWVVWGWIGAVAVVLVQVLLGGDPEAERARIRSRRRRLVRASASGSAVVAAVAAALLAINSAFAAFPSLAAVLGSGVATTPLSQIPAAAPLAQAPVRAVGALEASWTPPAGMPTEGVVATAEIPAGAASGEAGFSPRAARIYLPPAYLTAKRPALPVVVLLSGQPGSPSDWYELGELKTTMDAYAAAHHGLAPIVVSADLLGGPYANPLCSDTRRGGNVATYLEKVVPEWIRTRLQVDDDPRHWAVAGLSNGATCSLQVISRDPSVYRTFLAMSSELHPSLGTEERTIRIGFDGDRAGYLANDPLSILRSAPKGRYDGVAGIISVGREDARYASAARVLAKAAQEAGIAVEQRRYEGAHTWAVWSVAYADQIGWLGGRLGISG